MPRPNPHNSCTRSNKWLKQQATMQHPPSALGKRISILLFVLEHFPCQFVRARENIVGANLGKSRLADLRKNRASGRARVRGREGMLSQLTWLLRGKFKAEQMAICSSVSLPTASQQTQSRRSTIRPPAPIGSSLQYVVLAESNKL